jgi:hypothetical protein
MSARTVVEYRWFPAQDGSGLLGGICAETAQEARESGTHAEAHDFSGCRWVRVRLEYSLPPGMKVREG